MPQFPNRQFLDFEQPIKEIFEQIEETRKLAEKNAKVDYSSNITQLEQEIILKRKQITDHLSPWQRVQLSRHPDRPYTHHRSAKRHQYQIPPDAELRYG